MGLNTIRLEGKLEDDAVLRHHRSRGHPGDARLVLLRPLGEVEGLGRRGPARRDRVPARPDPAPARPRLRLHLAQRLRRPAARARRAGLPRGVEGAGLPEPGGLLGHREEGGALRRERDEDARALRVGAAALLVHRHEDRRPARLRHRDRPGSGAAAAREPEALHPRGPALADRRSVELPLRRRPVQDARGLHEGDGRALRSVEGRRRVRAQGPGRGLRVAPRHARVVRRAQVHGDRRRPVDAEQRLAGHDLAPLRLLPAAGRLLLRRQEGGRAAARAVRLRRPLGGGRQRSAAGADAASRPRRASSTSRRRSASRAPRR